VARFPSFARPRVWNGVALGIGLALLAPARVRAQTLAVSGDPGVLSVSAAAAGGGLMPASDASTTITVTITSANQKLVARLDAPLPSGITLTMRVVPPPGAASRGAVALSTSEQEIVGPVSATGTYPGLQIVYQLSATVAAGPVPATARAVIISAVAGP
jgi:hypothetical protein